LYLPLARESPNSGESCRNELYSVQSCKSSCYDNITIITLLVHVREIYHIHCN